MYRSDTLVTRPQIIMATSQDLAALYTIICKFTYIACGTAEHITWLRYTANFTTHSRMCTHGLRACLMFCGRVTCSEA